MNEKIDIYHILKANSEAYGKGEKLPYTKKQYVNSKYGDNCNALLFWNLQLPHAKQFTKQEHSAALGCDVLAILFWNLQLPHAKQYTEDEINNLKK